MTFAEDRLRMTVDNCLLAISGLASPFGGPFDLALNAGECVCVLGRSGSGKSVLLRLIADMDPGTGGVNLAGKRRETFAAPAWRGRVIYQSAEPAWWASTPAAHFPSAASSRVAELMAALGLGPDLLDADIARLSTGERQRLALVRSMVREPDVLLLDEPSASLDGASTLAIESLLLQQLRSGLGIVMVTHSREQAVRMSHRHFEMRDGKLHAP
ncbi:ABC transporter ATP-binding protein [Variovorax sp. PAMC 28711]|nr:ATP-binding cassette domain-containing protein [Variovorax sp. PAMC 28711]